MGLTSFGLFENISVNESQENQIIALQKVLQEKLPDLFTSYKVNNKYVCAYIEPFNMQMQLFVQPAVSGTLRYRDLSSYVYPTNLGSGKSDCIFDSVDDCANAIEVRTWINMRVLRGSFGISIGFEQIAGSMNKTLYINVINTKDIDGNKHKVFCYMSKTGKATIQDETGLILTDGIALESYTGYHDSIFLQPYKLPKIEQYFDDGAYQVLGGRLSTGDIFTLNGRQYFYNWGLAFRID